MDFEKGMQLCCIPFQNTYHYLGLAFAGKRL